jgi:hypothetical protein
MSHSELVALNYYDDQQDYMLNMPSNVALASTSRDAAQEAVENYEVAPAYDFGGETN